MSTKYSVDRLIIGGGLYGLYSALFCGSRGMSVVVLEKDSEPFKRATYINQARVHMGYHYPRSLTTAVKSAGYFKRFVDDYGFCIHQKFDQVYATSENFSWTQAQQFIDFCKAANIRCDEVAVSKYFKPGMCDGAFLTEEYTYDAHKLRDYLLAEISKYPNIQMIYNVDIDSITKNSDVYLVVAKGSEPAEEVYEVTSGFVLNATYASVNQVLKHIYPEDMFKIKYELCEIILCDAAPALKDVGITVMDGPFFSIMPFGLTGMHSLTAVTFTPHVTSYEDCPRFKCQESFLTSQSGDDIGRSANGAFCSPVQLGNCNDCPNKPQSAWPYMSHLVDKYLKPEYGYTYNKSLFSMKPILKSSEVDDSRPTAIRVHSKAEGGVEPTFISVLSGKINTVYDLDEYLI